MGSGGGGGGSSPNRRRKAAGGESGGQGAGAGCDLSFETDLSAIETSISATLAKDDALIVGLEKREDFDAVVCRTSEGKYVGTVSHIENLAQLLGCIKQGVAYMAQVTSSSATHCSVIIANA